MPSEPFDGGRYGGFKNYAASIKGGKKKKPYKHGTRTKYLFDKCRCKKCCLANSQYKNPFNKKRRDARLDPEYNRRLAGFSRARQRVTAWREEQKARGFDKEFWKTIGT